MIGRLFKRSTQPVRPDFAAQLGLPFVERHSWSPQADRIFSILAAQINGCKADAERLLSENDRALIEKYQNASSLAEVSARHYYATTALVSLAEEGRKKSFLDWKRADWLSYDNSVALTILLSSGQLVAPQAAAGVFAHYAVERALGSPIEAPQVRLAEAAFERVAR